MLETRIYCNFPKKLDKYPGDYQRYRVEIPSRKGKWLAIKSYIDGLLDERVSLIEISFRDDYSRDNTYDLVMPRKYAKFVSRMIDHFVSVTKTSDISLVFVGLSVDDVIDFDLKERLKERMR